MGNKDSGLVNEPAMAVLSENVRKTGLLGQVMKLSRPEKEALISYLQQDLIHEAPFQTDASGRILLTTRMKSAAQKAQKDFENGLCYTEDAFKQRFAKWL